MTSTTLTKSYGQYCRQIRKSKKLSVRVLSLATDIHPGAIIKFELGKSDMTISRFFKIVQYLGITMVDMDSFVRCHHETK